MLFKNKQLRHALKTGDITFAISCIKEGAVLEQKWLANFLRTAIKDNNLKTIKTYIGTGLNLEIPVTVNSKKTMLHHAAHTGRTMIVHLLAENNANTNTYSASGESALSDAACRDGQNAANIIKILVEHGADMNYQSDIFLRTALMRASHRNNPEAVKMLLELGANQSLTDTDGKTAWELSRSYTSPIFPEFKIEIDKEIAEKEKKQTALKKRKSSTWSACFNQSIAHIQTSEEIGTELKEIFNFSAREVITIVRNTKTNFESHSKETFAEYRNRQQLEKACIEYNRLPNTDTPVNLDDILQAKTKIIDGKTTSKTPIKIVNHNTVSV